MSIDKEMAERLFEAIANEDFSLVIEEIKQGLNINQKLQDGETLLHKAFRFKKISSVEHLILAGAKIHERNTSQRTPIHLGAANGFFEGCELYTLLTKNLNQQDHKGRIPLMHAIKYRQKPIIKLLMGRGSDTNLEDNNGFSSLMWAIKFLNPEELKEIFSDKEEEVLEEQLIKHNDEGKEVHIADETIESYQETLKESIEDHDNSEVMPNPLKEMLKKKEGTDDIIPYSISDHIESLKKRNDEIEATSYSILPERNEEDNKSQEAIDYEIGSNDSNSNKSIESFSRATIKDETSNTNKSSDINEKLFRSEDLTEVVSANSESDIEITRVSGAQRDHSSNSDDDSMVVKSSGNDQIITENEKIKISSSTINENENEALKITRPEGYQHESDEVTSDNEVQIVSNSDMQNLEESKKVTVKRINSSTDSEDQPEHKRVSSGGYEREDNEALEVKKLEPTDHEDLYKREDKKNEDTHFDSSSPGDNQNRDKASIQRVEGSDAAVIIDRKKDITYLKDSYREEYKDDYGEIRSVDKTISKEKLSEIKETDKNLTPEELQKIKETDKVVRPDYDIKYLDPKEVEEVERINIEGKVTHEKIDQKETVQDQSGPIERKDIQRPDRNVPETYQEEVFEGDIKKRNQPQTTEEALYRVAKGSEEVDFDGKGEFQFKSLKDDETSPVDKEENISTKTKESEELNQDQKNDNESVDESSEDDPNLSTAENKLLQAMSDPDHKNKKGQTLCWLAAYNGQLELLKKLIHKGANYEIKDPKGVSPLMAASMKGHTEIVEYLVHKVRNVDEKRSDSQTALSLSIQYDRDEIIKILINNGANSESKIKGQTLLMIAAEHNAVKCINTLILLGADPLEKNIRGKMAIDIAKMKKKKEAYLILAKVMKARLKQSVEDAELGDNHDS